MSALDFLIPSTNEVAARSPMHRLAAKAGAQFEVRDGWEVATRYEGGREYSNTVGFADRSQLVKLELNGALAAPLKLGAAVERDRNWWCPVTPTRTLLLGDPSARTAVPAGVNVVDVTCGLAALELIGALAGELLARFCAIDVRLKVTPVGAFRPGSIARTPGYLLRPAENRLLIMVGAALGAYLWEVVADAADHLGGGPVA
jgi:glycine cleavage system aminomethyltransferase T